ncbi:MAG: hypothetical protein SPK03_00710, partial [Alloprevotella sp.]|nr:hypothetical protein [Alloprevotella sp.]
WHLLLPKGLRRMVALTLSEGQGPTDGTMAFTLNTPLPPSLRPEKAQSGLFSVKVNATSVRANATMRQTVAN